MEGFEYPERAYVRRHAPGGYKSYESYRDWLRDEFEFRCVYCLHREQWYGRATTFHIDHHIPVVDAPQLTLEYTNLLYTCATCNTAKNDTRDLPDPCTIAFAKCIRFLENGMVEALNKTGIKLVMKLKLNSPDNVGYRSRLVRILAIMRLHEHELYKSVRKI